MIIQYIMNEPPGGGVVSGKADTGMCGPDRVSSGP